MPNYRVNQKTILNTVLIADENPADAQQILAVINALGYPCTVANNAAKASHKLREQPYDLLICAHALTCDPSNNLIATANNTTVLVTIPFSNDIASAVDAMNKGAASCIAKPINQNELKLTAQRLLAARSVAPPKPKTSSNVMPLPQTPQNNPNTEPLPGMIGSSPAMGEVYRRIRKAGPTRSTVLIRGETGTGKELVARAIHDASERAKEPFIAVNCAAIPETLIESELFGHEKGSFTGAAGKRTGLIEAAEGGTLFLDEIGELPSEAQARLLRFIQESEIRRVGSNKSLPVNVRLVAATHRDLQSQAKTGGFRPDLYYRINVFRIFLPTLAQRGSDLLEIADYLLTKNSLKHGKQGLYFLPAAIQALSSYSWPGNVRELENAIERAAIMTDDLAIDANALEIDIDLSTKTLDFIAPQAHTISPSSAANFNEPVASPQKSRPSHNQKPDPQEGLSLEDYFQRFVLEHQEQMNETQLAKMLGISRKCLWERRQRFDIPRAKSMTENNKLK